MNDVSPRSAECAQDAVASTVSGVSLAERAAVDRARRGDRDAFHSLIVDHQTRVYRLIRRVLRCPHETAEDVSQEVFLRAFRGLDGFDGAVPFWVWLRAITMNASLTEYRKQRAQKRGAGGSTLSLDAPFESRGGEPGAATPDPVSPELGPAAHADQRDFARLVRIAVDALPPDFRQAVMLRDLDGLSYEDIAELTGISLGTVRSRIHRGRVMLQQKLRRFEP